MNTDKRSPDVPLNTFTFRSLKVLALFLLLGALLVGCSKPAQEPAVAPAPETQSEAESRVKHGTNGEVIITLDARTQKLMGLQTASLTVVRLSPEMKGYGRVLDVSPLASLVAELVTAQAASAASQAELKRLKTLAGQNNASERALQTAEAAAVRDQTQVESARLKLLANWGAAIAKRDDLPAFVQCLGSQASALVELDLPAGEPAQALPTGARLVTLDNAAPLGAQFMSPAPAVDPQVQGQGFLFLVSSNEARLIPGAAVTGFMSLPGEPQSGVVLPRNTVVHFNGATWVYVQTAEDTFERVEVTLDRPLDGGWFVREGLKPKQNVVTVGAQELLSEELKGKSEE